MVETITVTLEAGGEETELEVADALVEMLNEGDEPAASVVADIAMLGLAQQAHGAVHHAHGEPNQELVDAEEVTMELFEERFGQSYGEVTGHSH